MVHTSPRAIYCPLASEETPDAVGVGQWRARELLDCAFRRALMIVPTRLIVYIFMRLFQQSLLH